MSTNIWTLYVGGRGFKFEGLKRHFLNHFKSLIHQLHCVLESGGAWKKIEDAKLCYLEQYFKIILLLMHISCLCIYPQTHYPSSL
jgi:hypothetical protein